MAGSIHDNAENGADPLLAPPECMKENIEMSNFGSRHQTEGQSNQNSEVQIPSTLSVNNNNFQNCFGRDKNQKIAKVTWLSIMVLINLICITMWISHKISVDKTAAGSLITLVESGTEGTLEIPVDTDTLTKSPFKRQPTRFPPKNDDDPSQNPLVTNIRNKHPKAFSLTINSKIRYIPANVDIILTIRGNDKDRDWITWQPTNTGKVVAVVLDGHFDPMELQHFQQTFLEAKFFS